MLAHRIRSRLFMWKLGSCKPPAEEQDRIEFEPVASLPVSWASLSLSDAVNRQPPSRHHSLSMWRSTRFLETLDGRPYGFIQAIADRTLGLQRGFASCVPKLWLYIGTACGERTV